MKSFVITILNNDRSVKSSQRCIESGSRFGIDIEVFPACTPEDNPAEILKKEGIPLDNFNEVYSRFDRVLSCFVSHYKLWQACAESKENYLIFEHDAVVMNRIDLNVYFTGALSFGAPSYGSYNVPHRIGVSKLISKQYFPGAHAYLLKPKAARKIIERAKIDACPTDVFLSNLRFDFLEEYYPWPVVVKDSFTTVQNINGCKAKHSYKKNPERFEII